MNAIRTPDDDADSEAPEPRGLIICDGPDQGRCLPLRSPVTLLGCAAACDIRADAATVRPLHCLLAPQSTGVAIRVLHANGVKVNGELALPAELLDGDVLEIGSCRYRLHWPCEDSADAGSESMRIQAAALVAQQAALGERELQLVERESAISQHEHQIADRLEEQRRQLLELQDQITAARSSLREKRAAHAAMVEEQQRELVQAREETLELQRSAKSEHLRLIELRRRMIQRGRRYWQARRKASETRGAELQRLAARLSSERHSLAEQDAQFNGRAELDKRRLKDAWDRLHKTQREWQTQRSQGDAQAADRIRELARRAKAVAAAERQLESDRANVQQEVAERRKELDQLETRIANARALLLRQQPEPFQPALPSASVGPTKPLALPAVNAVANVEHRDPAIDRRAESLERVAEELADQRLHLAEQAERLLRTQEQWHEDRSAALRELETIGIRFQARELDLDRRVRELGAARARIHAEYESLVHLRLKIEAEQTRAATKEADRRAELDARWCELNARERTLTSNEENWRGLLRLWGRRRWQEVLQLRAEQAACRQERSEWVAARRVWLRTAARIRNERRIVAAQALALEQWRKENLPSDERAAAAKRLERLERQWAAQCATAARELERFQDTLAIEASRLDEQSRRSRRESLDVAARSVTLNDQSAEIERERRSLVAERERMTAQLDLARIRWETAERRALDLREEVERVARLLIDSGPVLALPTSQAA